MKHLKLYLIFLFTAFLCCPVAKAQSMNGHFLPFGLGYARETVKDNSLSPVSYSGSLGSITLGYYYQNQNWISMLDISGMAGFQHPDVSTDESIKRETTTGLGRASYRLLRRIITYKGFRLYGGILSHNLLDYRQHNRYTNSSENYAALFSYGPAFLLQRPFTVFNKNFVIQYDLGLPFGTYYLRPGYVKPFLAEKLSSKGSAFWGDYYLLDSRTDLIWLLPNGNQLRLSYNWEYTQLDVLNKLQTGLHQISLSTIFRF